MAGVKDPRNGLGEAVSRIDDAWNVNEDKVAGSFPVLDCKKLDVDVASADGGATSINDLDGRFIVFVDRCGTILREAKFAKN